MKINEIINEVANQPKGVAEGSVTPDVNVNKVHDDGHEKEWHIYRGKEMIGYVILNQDDTAEGLYIAYSHLPGRPFVEEFTGLKSAVNYIASLKEGVAEGSKRLPDIRQFDKTVLDKQFGGSMVKMAQALKDAGFSNERILQKISDFKQGVAEGAEDFEGTYSPEAIQLGKRFCEHYNITNNDDIQLAIEIIDQDLEQFKATNTPVDLKKIRSSVSDAFRQVYRGMGPGPNFRKKFQEQGVAEGLQNPAQEQINQILRSQAPNGNVLDDRYLDWIIGPESIQRLAQQTKLPLNQVRNYVTAFCQNPDPEGIEEGEITKTATGTKHRSTAAYGGTEKDTDHLRTLDKATTNKIDKAIGVKFKKQGRGLDLGETTAAGSVSTVPAVGGGTLFGGNYSNSSSPFKKKSVKKESIIKR